MTIINREQWLNEAATRILPMIAQHTTLPDWDYRISVGFPKGARTALAVCWKKEASKDNVCEIFVTPAIDDSYAILTALTHELIHYSDNCESGHQGHFARVALGLGFARPLPQLQPEKNGLDLELALLEIIDELGDIPHAALDANKSGQKKQGTRLRKVICTDCDFTMRTTDKWLGLMRPNAACPCCDIGTLIIPAD